MKNNKIHLYKKILFAVIALVLLFFTSKIILAGGGSDTKGRSVFLLMSLIIILSSSKKAFWFLVFPAAILHAIYSPIGLTFGQVSYQYAASIFSTDLIESQEFIGQIPAIDYAYPFLIIAGILLFRYITQKFEINFYQNKTVLCIIIIFAMLRQPPFQFINSLLDSSSKVQKELVELNNFTAENAWPASTLENSDYDNYVLIIGESARMDYHHAYGYPVPNTPFMSTANGTLVTGLTSAGPNTVSSLRLMLTQPDRAEWEPNYALNFIDLAKSAGIKTYWLSNQPYIGKFDTPISAIANRSDYSFFTKYFSKSKKVTSDFDLIEEIKKTVQSNPLEKKLIVVHLYGSHPNACERIADYKAITTIKDGKYEHINCYVSSMNKTDDIISSINTIMETEEQEHNASYSMIYFSDHGMTHEERSKDGTIRLASSLGYAKDYEIPLFITASDAHERNECTSFKSGLNFLNGLASWMGIRNDQLPSHYSLFDCTDDTDDYGLPKKYNRSSDTPDLAIDIRDK